MRESSCSWPAGIPESAAPSPGFSPGLGIFSEPDLHNGTGSLPSVGKIALCQKSKGTATFVQHLTCMVKTELGFIIVLETQLGFRWLYSLMLSDEGLALIC